MAKALERDLGLYAVVTISIGAMIGSGLFVLPGIASTIAGPAVVLAYCLAGLLVVPAALSKAEMATAMPHSGGTYLFIDRGMGPALGTVAGIGVWFSLVFKSAFALVGLGSYLDLIIELPVKPVAAGLALLLIGVNCLGAKQSGRLQAVIVTFVFLVLCFFVAEGLPRMTRGNLQPFFPYGVDGLLAATGFVFVSYAGVTKIASVAEEVERPGRNIPLGILLSLGTMIVVYSLTVLTIVGVTTRDELGKTLTPMSDAAGQFLGTFGTMLVAGTALLSLTSMANAGILSSSRYPLAMARDHLIPSLFGTINPRWRTPVAAIAGTGALLLGLILVVPVTELAKLASAFQILVFVLVAAAHIILREGDAGWYRPTFVAPGYPWLQLAGIVGGLALLTQMGPVAYVGATVIVVAGIAWYRTYARSRTTREGAAPATLRKATDKSSLEAAREALDTDVPPVAVVSLRRDTDLETEAALVRLAARFVAPAAGRVLAVIFDEIPDQTALETAVEQISPEDLRFEERMERLAGEIAAPVEAFEIVSHNRRRAVVNFARRVGATIIMSEWTDEPQRWLMVHAPCDVIFAHPRGNGEIARIGVVADRGPYDPLEIWAAAALARTGNPEVEFVYALDRGFVGERLESINEYHGRLLDLFPAAATTRVLETRDRAADLLRAADDFDLVIMSESGHHFLYDVVFGEIPDEVADRASCTVLLVHSRKPFRHTFLRWIMERVAY